ncbi:MAG: copper transporter [Thermoleophilaceae bacterium]
MLDFRYHALSLVAVFLALGIGIVLGSSLGDTVVSQANRDLANSLRGDLNAARADATRARAGVAERERLLEQAANPIAAGRLRGEQVALVSSGALPAEVQSDAREAVRLGGGRLGLVAQLASPPDLATLGRTVGPRFATLRSDDPRLRPLGRRVGRALVSGGRLARKLVKRFPDRFSGPLSRAGAVAYYRDSRERTDAEKQFEQGLIEGLRSVRQPLVGIERLDTDPSQIPFYSAQRITSVDNVDSAGGRIALVLALSGPARTRGESYGYKKTADATLPETVGARTSNRP